METAFSVAGKFGLTSAEARAQAREVAGAVRKWASVAKQRGLKRKELERMESAFEHADLELASR
ncbi:MAG TPA: hypothetical protein VGK67_12785 [Myxococcales bacterium]